MRTTIEITDEQRSKLLEAAAKRGEKGFSSIIQEALDHYFQAAAGRRERVERAVKVLGTLTEPSADRLEKDVRKLRRSWR
jgi:metal-responsive CopG/Arc/MetJ family transcriptional regulator